MRDLRRAWAGVALGLVLGLLAGCTTFIVDSDHDPDADFDSLHSWAWLPGAGPRGDLGSLDPEVLDREVRVAVERVLAEKGYTHQRSGTPDFLVGYHAVVVQKESERAMNEYYGYAGGVGYAGGGVRTQRVAERYEEGSLVLDVSTDAGSRLVWRGGVQARLAETQPQHKRIARLHEAIEKILASFPP